MKKITVFLLSLGFGMLLVLSCGKPPAVPPIPPPAPPEMTYTVTGRLGAVIEGELNSTANYSADYAKGIFEASLAGIDTE